MLIENGADVNAKSGVVGGTKPATDGVLAAPWMAFNLRFILSKNDPCRTEEFAMCMMKVAPLHVAALNGSYEVVAMLIENGADVNTEMIVSNKGTGTTPLHFTALSRNWLASGVTTLLIENGADVMRKESNDLRLWVWLKRVVTVRLQKLLKQPAGSHRNRTDHRIDRNTQRFAFVNY